MFRIYDNGGKTIDRYTAVYMGKDDIQYRSPHGIVRSALGFNENPFHPLGFGQYTTAVCGRHLGKRIKFEDLPDKAKEFLKRADYTLEAIEERK